MSVDTIQNVTPAPLPNILPERFHGTPSPDAFKQEIDGDETELDFLPASNLQSIAQSIIGKYKERFKHLYGLEIEFLWKRQGGRKNGVATVGQCQKPSGLLKHYSKADYVIWLAADHCRNLGLTALQIEAALFHELMHTDEDWETGKLRVRAHDAEMFVAEITEYGLWRPALQHAGREMRQARLWDGNQPQ